MKLAVPLVLFVVFHPIGSEFRVNSTTGGDQYGPAVAAGAQGTFVVAWSSTGNAGEDAAGVFAKRFTNFAGFSEFHVNTYTTGVQTRPSVAMDVEASFVVSWEGVFQGGGASFGVFARSYDGDGAPRGAEFRVATSTAGYENRPAAAMDPAGNFVVAFDTQDASNVGTFARRFRPNGTPLGQAFLVNVTTTNEQAHPFVAFDSSGAFVVAWTGKSQDGGNYDIFVRRYGPDGVSRGTEFRVNTDTIGKQLYPTVSTNPAGAFVVAWNTKGTDPQAAAISARAYRADGSAQTAEILVNTYTTARIKPAALSLPDGGFVVVYSGYREVDPAASADILLRHFDAAGKSVGGELRVNTSTTGLQTSPVIAGHARGFVVVWESDNGDGSGRAIFARNFSVAPVPGDVDGDGNVSVADVFYLINFLFAGGPAPAS